MYNLSHNYRSEYHPFTQDIIKGDIEFGGHSAQILIFALARGFQPEST